MEHQVDILPVTEWQGQEIGNYDKIIIGASIRYGKHSPLVYDFIGQNRALLESRASAFFTVNIVARKPEKNRPETNPYMQKFLARTNWQPDRLAVFAGRLDYQSYGFLDRTMIRFIMFVTRGPTAADTVIEYTDWNSVGEFAREISVMQAGSSATGHFS
jgi:menaquinone-dependent protoporphyrinogen oxidase